MASATAMVVALPLIAEVEADAEAEKVEPVVEGALANMPSSLANVEGTATDTLVVPGASSTAVEITEPDCPGTEDDADTEIDTPPKVEEEVTGRDVNV